MIYGILTSSGLPGTGWAISDFTMPTAGEDKELTGNPASTIIDRRAGKVSQSITANYAFLTIPTASEIRALIGVDATVTITSEDTQGVSLAGKISAFDVKGSKDDWWVATCTVKYVAA